MPIDGLTMPEDFRLYKALPQIAKLYKGAPKPEGRPGKDLDFFRVEFNEEYEDARELWTDMFGEQPTEFGHIILVGQTIDEIFATWKDEYNSANVLTRRCDGVHIQQRYNEGAGMNVYAKTPCEAPQCQCKERGYLDFVIPAFTDATGVLGTFSLRTGSIYDIIELYNHLQFIQQTYGRLAGIPFVLGRSHRQVHYPEIKNGERTGKRRKGTRSLLYIRPTKQFTSLQWLPAIQETTQQAPALPEPQIDVETARQALGSGGTRRVVTSPPEKEIEPDFSAWEFDQVWAYLQEEYSLSYEEWIRRKETFPDEWKLCVDQTNSKQEATILFASRYYDDIPF